ncbi:MAG: carbamoyl phosphate synthase-like protein [Methanoregulaceae archaeon PtaB.Bin108]|nr:MAG: carbamoyl phosphate synthase-like protein [Methanoregulaceae archaeon PtaB.Bin108]OPY44043.1 MAG: carbamoyl phosphate synthase-like protein [Methanoregulaceae archaeon PtaU1.Bin222]
MKGSVLVCGFSTRHVARSARRAGYTVYAVDHFCDQDLSWYTRDRIRFDELDDLPGAIGEICSRHKVEWLVPTSGAELLPGRAHLLGTPPNHAHRFMDKLLTQEYFESLDIPVPKIVPAGQFPAMIKPRNGSGGWRNRIVRDNEELSRWLEDFDYPPHILQQVVPGTAASVCCIADGAGNARAIAANRQILRGEECGNFGFSGSLTPYTGNGTALMMDMAEKIAGASGCKGTLGIDFVLGDEPWAIEVNPRFQATLDTVEASTGINLFSVHADACQGLLPGSRPSSCGFSVRRILFADRDVEIGKDLSPLTPAVADIPWPGTFFEEGHAIVSVFGWGNSADQAMTCLDKNMKRVRQYMG